jgi:Ecdysteroid kinase-like family
MVSRRLKSKQNSLSLQFVDTQLHLISSQAIYDIALQKTKHGKTHEDVLKETFYAKIFESIENMESTQKDVLKVLSHRDVWKNNMMFKFNQNENFENPSHCVLLDFQTVRYLSISIDVLMAIICTTTRSHYEKNFSYYLKFYYKQLSMELQKFSINLSSKMSFENFAKNCEYHKIFALVYNVVVLMITMIPQDFFVDFSEDEFRDFAEGNRSKFILDNMKRDSFYEESLIEAVEAVIEFVYKLP